MKKVNNKKMGIYYNVLLECSKDSKIIKSFKMKEDVASPYMKSPIDFTTIQHLLISPTDLQKISSKDGEWKLHIEIWCTMEVNLDPDHKWYSVCNIPN